MSSPGGCCAADPVTPPAPSGTVLLLGADGFIGRHIGAALRARRWQVIACARRPDRLARMGFATLRADLEHPATHDPAFWSPHLTGVTAIVNAAGLLTGAESRFRAVHHDAPAALYQALPPECSGLLISAIGIDTADTAFARHRRDAETLASRHGLTILRPGLVLGETSYGGSSLLRALAACPLVTPVIGDGQQPFNPIHADDLAAAIADLLHKQHVSGPHVSGPYAIGGPEQVAQSDMLRAYRGWLGLRPVPPLHLPLPVARALGRVGDLLRLGPISRTAVDQLSAGVLAPAAPEIATPIRGFSTFLAARPAGTQDLWHARLYLLRPLLRFTLALMWLASGLIGLTLAPDSFLPLLSGTALPDSALVALARLGGAADILLGLALLRGTRLRLLALAQGALIGAYTLAFTLLAPALWLLPLGGLLKNLPILMLVLIHGILEDER